MGKQKIFCLASMFVFLQVSAQDVFELKGVIVADTVYTRLFINFLDANGESVSDTIQVIGNEFVYQGHIKCPTITFICSEKAAENEAAFFLEPDKRQQIEIYGKDFRQFSFSGSVTQQEYKTFTDEGKHLKNYEAHQAHAMQYIEAHPDSFVSLKNLGLHFSHIPFEKADSLFGSLSDPLKESFQGKELQARIDKRRVIAKGSAARDFTRLSYSGDTITLSDFKGRYVLLDFWGSWCVPCREEIPLLKEIASRYRDSLVFIGVANDKDLAAWQKAVVEDGTDSLIQVMSPDIRETDWQAGWGKDNDRWLHRQYVVALFPTKVLIRPDGKIMDVYLGQKGTLELKERLRTLMGKD